MPYKRKDLVALIFATNDCYHQVVSVDDERVAQGHVTVDHKAGTWTLTLGDCSRSWPIGSKRYTNHGQYGGFEGHSGIICVYDRTDIQHLSSMVHTVGDLVRS